MPAGANRSRTHTRAIASLDGAKALAMIPLPKAARVVHKQNDARQAELAYCREARPVADVAAELRGLLEAAAWQNVAIHAHPTAPERLAVRAKKGDQMR